MAGRRPEQADVLGGGFTVILFRAGVVAAALSAALFDRAKSPPEPPIQISRQADIPPSDQVSVLQVMVWQYRALADREQAQKEMLATPAGLRYLEAQKRLDEANRAIELHRVRLAKQLHCDPCRIDETGTHMVPVDVPTILTSDPTDQRGK